MHGITKFGVSRSLVILAVLSLLSVSVAAAASRPVERNLDLKEMTTSFGGLPVSWLCCGFNSGCYWANTYTQSCVSLTGSGASMCTAVTMYQGNTQRCTPTT